MPDTPYNKKTSPECIRCGQCMSVCPLFAATGKEQDVARGKMALVKWAGKDPSRAKNAAAALSRCLLCGACADVCANRVPTTQNVVQGRAISRPSRGPSLSVSLQVKALTGDDAYARAMRKGGALLQALACGKIAQSSGLYFRFPLSFFMQREMIPALSPVPFLEKPLGKRSDPGPLVGFFVGCGANHIFTQTAASFERLAARAGLRLVIPKDQVCCGLPALVSGDLETARERARKNMEIFSSLKLDALVTVCASCGHHILSWPELFAPGTQEFQTALRLAGLHKDASAVLMEAPGFSDMLGSQARKVQAPLRVFYHAPCHQRFGPGKTEAPLKLLQSMPKAVEILGPKLRQCCGHGGSFNLSHHDISVEILKNYFNEILAQSPDSIATGCNGCMMQMMEGAYRWGKSKNMEVLHPLVLFERLLGY